MLEFFSTSAIFMKLNKLLEEWRIYNPKMDMKQFSPTLLML